MLNQRTCYTIVTILCVIPATYGTQDNGEAMVAEDAKGHKWGNRFLDNWDNGWTTNIYGEPIDVETACDGKPCQRTKLTRPAPPDDSEKFCKSYDEDDGSVVCNYLPEGATLVGDKDEAESEKKYNITKPTRRLHNRSQWPISKSIDQRMLLIWSRSASFTYNIIAQGNALARLPDAIDYVQAGFQLWASSCGSENAAFINRWVYTPDAAQASIWFILQPGTVCGLEAALACAFFPSEYDIVSNTVLIDNSRVKNVPANMAILTIAHEMGHVFGLGHEKPGKDSDLWYASAYDPASIMIYNAKSLHGISSNDCLAMKYYSNGFPTVYRCRPHATLGRICTAIVTEDILPVARVPRIRVVTSNDENSHDELLEDAYMGACIGSNMSLYNIDYATDLGGGQGRLNQGTVLNQCEGVIIPSDPNYAYVMQSDGNLISYNIVSGVPIWATNSYGLGSGDYSAMFEDNGNLNVYGNDGSVIWSSQTSIGSPLSFRLHAFSWILANNGNIYLKDEQGRYVWGSTPVVIYSDVLIRLSSTSFCLGNDPNESTIRIMPCIAIPRLQWIINNAGNIINKGSGLCLSNAAGHSNAGNPVILWQCGGTSDQVWQLRSDGSIFNPASGKCLDNRNNYQYAGNPVQIWDCNTSVAQDWPIQAV